MEESSNASDFVRMRERRDSPEPPNSFLCPITCEIMADPVMDADGNTYERWAITRWLEKSQQSPITRMPIGSRMLVPNRALKAIIDDWRKKNNVPLPSMRSRPASVSMSNRSGTSADRRLSRGGSSSRNRIGFRVSTLNVVLVAGCDSVRKVAKLLNTVPENKRLVDGVQMVLVFSQRKNAMFACERGPKGRWHTGHRTNTHFGNVREITLVDPEAPIPTPARHQGSRSSRSRLSRPHSSHGLSDSDSASIQLGQRRLTNVSPPVQRTPLVAHKRSTSGPATDGLMNCNSRAIHTVHHAMRKVVSSNNNLYTRKGMPPNTSMRDRQSKSSMGRSGRNSRMSRQSGISRQSSRQSGQDMSSGVYSPRPPLPSSGSKRYQRHRTPLTRDPQSSNSRRVRINQNAVRMAPPRDHNYALRRWLRSPILVIEEESVDMSSYELSISSDCKKKKKRKKKKANKNNSAVEDEYHEVPAPPFRHKLTDDEMGKAVKQMLREGTAYWDAGDVVSCTMVYLKFAREQADDCPEIKRVLRAGKFAIIHEPDRSLALRLRRAFDSVLARVLPPKVRKMHDDNESDRRTPSPPQLTAMLSPPPMPRTHQPSPPPMPKAKTPSPLEMRNTRTPSSAPVQQTKAPTPPPVPKMMAPTPPPLPKTQTPSPPFMRETRALSQSFMRKMQTPLQPSMPMTKTPSQPSMSRARAPTSPLMRRKKAPSSPLMRGTNVPSPPSMHSRNAPSPPPLPKTQTEPSQRKVSRRSAPSPPPMPMTAAPSSPSVPMTAAPSPPSMPRTSVPSPPSMPLTTVPSPPPMPPSVPRTAVPSPPSMPRTSVPSPPSMPRTSVPSPPSMPRTSVPSPPSMPKTTAPSPPPMPRTTAPSPPPMPRTTAPSPPPMPRTAAPSPPPMPRTQTLTITPPPTSPTPTKILAPTTTSGPSPRSSPVR